MSIWPRHLVIYGPTAAGKLTVARALSELVGIGLVDNHMTGDIGRRLFARGTPEIDALVAQLRFEVARAAATAKVDMITTFVFNSSTDVSYVEQLREVVESAGGKIVFVQLHAPPEVLAVRVTSESRASKRALRDPDELLRSLATYEPYAVIEATIMSIDSSIHPADDSARMIAEAVFPDRLGSHN